ncbi:MAG: hypothetical protein COW90_06795 [Nitrospirae bacterium CG22_combo_CG10-13_8_21_14_all_44_11]|nr:MAG: hypothetical protein COW90_06795 [Nitrospirae bacterium CG22_combo_CG10-13_8_21_14_all_44_11]PIV66703.1 MAG: hypothetical protein COS10_04765 [Nitrospirae bacterium CG01_land_8_20_14_3_00_44_22]
MRKKIVLSFLYRRPASALQAKFIKDPDIRSRIVYSQDKDLWKRHLSGFKSPRHEEIEFRIVTKSGEIKWLSHLCAPIYENDVFLGRRVSNRYRQESA